MPDLVIEEYKRSIDRTLIRENLSKSHEERIRALEQLQRFAGELPRTESAVHIDPEILGGTPVFVGTRVPVQTLLDYLGKGRSLDEFLDDFPTVMREQAVAALEQAKELLLANAHSA